MPTGSAGGILMSKQTTPIIHHGEKIGPEQIAALMAEASGWRPRDGEEIRGTVLGAKWGFSELRADRGGDGSYPIVVILLPEDETYQPIDDKGEPVGEPNDVIAIHGMGTVIESEFFSLRPQPGESLYIKKIGKRGVAKRKGYDPPILWAVAVTSREGKPVDFWDRAPVSARARAAGSEEVPHPADTD